jgi:hypothetical protein
MSRVTGLILRRSPRGSGASSLDSADRGNAFLVCHDRTTAVCSSASLSRLNLGSLLFVSNGGLGLLFALWVSAKIRGWNRISIFIAFFSLVALAVLLEHVRRHWIKTSPAWFLFHGVLAGILV